MAYAHGWLLVVGERGCDEIDAVLYHPPQYDCGGKITHNTFLNDLDLLAEILPHHTNPRLAHTSVAYIQNNQNLPNKYTHTQLQDNLKIHNWLLCGDKEV
jgi:hypothetical protein